MSKRENRLAKILEKDKKALEKSVKLNTLPSANITKKELITFGFKDLNLNRGKFKCNSGHGNQLLTVFGNLVKHSSYDRISIGTRLQFHAVPYEEIKKHFLDDLVKLSGGSKIFQLGSRRTTERIIGFFNVINATVFEVCLLDLDHQISG